MGFTTGTITPYTRFAEGDFRATVPRNSPENLAANMPLVQLISDWAGAQGRHPGPDLAGLVDGPAPWIVPIPSTTRTAHLAENLGAEEVTFSDRRAARPQHRPGGDHRSTVTGCRRPCSPRPASKRHRSRECSSTDESTHSCSSGSLTLGGARHLDRGLQLSPSCRIPQHAARPCQPTPCPGAASKVLLVYFSRAGENYYYGDRIDLEVGNTEVVADIIAGDHRRRRLPDRSRRPLPAGLRSNGRTQQTRTRPGRPPCDRGRAYRLSTGYDTVLLGSPIWNVRPPMIMRTFIEAVDLRGKTILPFVTYAVSGMGRHRRRLHPRSVPTRRSVKDSPFAAKRRTTLRPR